MCSREVVFTTALFINIGSTSLSLDSAPIPSPPYCLVAPGRKTVTALELVAMLLPLPVVVPADALAATGCAASRCSIAGWVPPQILHACLYLQKPWHRPSFQLLHLSIAWGFPPIFVKALSKFLLLPATGGGSRRVRVICCRSLSLSRHPVGSYTPRAIRFLWKVKWKILRDSKVWDRLIVYRRSVYRCKAWPSSLSTLSGQK